MAEIHYTYSEADNPELKKRVRVEEEDEEGEKSYEERVQEFQNLNPRQRKLAELRQKLRQSRYNNFVEIIFLWL